jgi:hypothetical protein
MNNSQEEWIPFKLLPRLGIKTGLVDKHGVRLEPEGTPRARSRGLKLKGLVPKFTRDGYYFFNFDYFDE